MTLQETLTGPDRDEIDSLLTTILRDVVNGDRSIKRAVTGLRQAIGSALCQSPNFMNELRAAAYA